MIGVGVPKTVDNDLFGVDHTPGYPSAARYVAMCVQQAGLLARDMQRVDPFNVFQTVGRSAGWLPAAASLAKKKPEDAAAHHPRARAALRGAEIPRRRGEGIQKLRLLSRSSAAKASPTPTARPSAPRKVTDKFSNVEFGAMGGTSAAMMLHRMLANAFGWRGEFQVTESLQMCAADRAVKLDFEEAYDAGKEAVRLAAAGANGVMVTIERSKARNTPAASARFR